MTHPGVVRSFARLQKRIPNACHLLLVTIGAFYLGTDVTSARSAPSIAKLPPPTTAELQSAIDAARPGAPRVAEFLGCLPAFQRPANVRLCVLAQQGSDHGLQEIPFRFSEGHWRILLDQTGKPAETSAACAPVAFAQNAFRTLHGDESLRVTAEVDDGEGTFTDRRGMSRNRQGSYRLMCRYEAVTGTGDKILFIAYVWYDGSQYLIDPDVEVWDDN